MNKAAQIATLIRPFVAQGKILARSEAQIQQNLDDFIVLIEAKKIVACVGLRDYQTQKMGEIYALAVHQSHQNSGHSLALLAKLMAKARQENFERVFALTKYGTDWFIKHGFSRMQLTDLPQNRQAEFDHARNSSIFCKDVN